MSNNQCKCCCKKRDCSCAPNPPPTCHSDITSLEGMNCIHCYDQKCLSGHCTNLNANLKSFNFNQFKNYLSTPVNLPPFDLNKAQFIPNPVLDIPPCQKAIYPPEVPLSDQLPIAGKIILIVGGSKGLGKNAAEYLSSKGAIVIATSRHPDCYKTPIGYTLSKQPLDIRSDESVNNFFNKVIKPLHKLNVVIICSGIHSAGPMTDTTANDMMNTLQLKPIGYQRVLYHAKNYLRVEPNSRFIAHGGIDATIYLAFGGVYNCANLFLHNWIDVTMLEERLLYGLSEINNPISYSLMDVVPYPTALGEYEQWTSGCVPLEYPPVKATYINWNSSTLGISSFINSTDFIYNSDAIYRIIVAPQPGTRYYSYGANQTIHIGDIAMTVPGFFTLVNATSATEVVRQTIVVTGNVYAHIEEQLLNLKNYFFGCKNG